MLAKVNASLSKSAAHPAQEKKCPHTELAADLRNAKTECRRMLLVKQRLFGTQDCSAALVHHCVLGSIVRDGHPLWCPCVRMIILGLYEKMKEITIRTITADARSILPMMKEILRRFDRTVWSNTQKSVR